MKFSPNWPVSCSVSAIYQSVESLIFEEFSTLHFTNNAKMIKYVMKLGLKDSKQIRLEK